MPRLNSSLQSFAARLRALSPVSEVREELEAKQPHLVCTLARPIFGRNLAFLVFMPEDGVLLILVPNLATLPEHGSFEEVRRLAIDVDEMLCGMTRISEGKLHYSMALPAGSTAGNLSDLIRILANELRVVIGSVLAISLTALIHVGPGEKAAAMIRKMDEGDEDAQEDSPELIAI